MANSTSQQVTLLGLPCQSLLNVFPHRSASKERSFLKRRQQNGLSLVEILVSLSVLALIGIVASSSLQQAIRLSETIEVRAKKLQQLQSFQSLLRSDIESSMRIYYPQQGLDNKPLDYPQWYETTKTSHNIVLAGRLARPFIGARGGNHTIIEDFFYSFEQNELIRHYKRHGDQAWVKSIIPMELQSFTVDRPSKSAPTDTSSKMQQGAVNSSQKSKMIIIKWANNAYGEMSLWSLEP